MRKRFLLLLLAVLAAVFLQGCGDVSGEIFRYDLAVPVTNLDPQFATEPEARVILINLHEGLVLQKPEGEIIPGCAERWEISEDGKRYTFYLREGLVWDDSDDTPLTAGDFAFALLRLFDSGTPSPYASGFSAIQNAGAWLSGDRTSPLGVRAEDDRRLVVTLDRADPLFLQQLATTAAFPCNREFFTSCRGRYGLEAGFVLPNGPFSLTSWKPDQIQLRGNENYHSPEEVLAAGVNFYIGRGDALSLLEDGKSDLANAPYSYLEAATRRGMRAESLNSTVWCVVFNLSDPVWRSPLLRQSLAYSVNREALEDVLQEGLSVTEVFAPGDLLLGDSPFDGSSMTSPVFYDENNARRLFDLGLETLGLTASPQLMILIPDSDEHLRYGQSLQQGWQKTLSFYPRLQRTASETLSRRYNSGEFQAVLLPFCSATSQPDGLFPLFRSGAADNRSGYQNPLYDSMLDRARQSSSLAEMSMRYGQAHSLLLSDAPILPLYQEATLCVLAKGVEGLWLYPFDERIYFKYAVK